MKKIFLLAIFSLYSVISAQGIGEIKISTEDGLKVTGFTVSAEDSKLEYSVPFISFLLDGELKTSENISEINVDDENINLTFAEGIAASVKIGDDFDKGIRGTITFTNNSKDTVDIANVVPLGQSEDHIYLTASGPWSLARTKIFRPGLAPLGVVLPDNAWELGYAAVNGDKNYTLAALTRRTEVEDAQKRRWRTAVFPGGSVSYVFYADVYEGEWQNGLKLFFRERFLYDIEGEFDNMMFEREDLEWIKHTWIMTLQMAWDYMFYDWKTQEYRLKEFLEEGERLLGGYDVYLLWPTWPSLGTDQRNQWDLYKDLPGGLEKLREFVRLSEKMDTKFFISYNPWDQSTRKEDHLSGMAELIRQIDAHGVVLDTRGSSSKELQQAADDVKEGVIMYSEGMAVPKDMQYIVSGRVHDAIYMPPPLNLNKYIKPDFSIYRVGQLREGRIHRETCVSLFNGIGVEMNIFGPGRPDWKEEEYLFLGRAAKVLRENSWIFHDLNWIPAIPTISDNIWVNEWHGDKKTLWTVYSLIPEGYNAPLFKAPADKDYHYVSIWHHKELETEEVDGALYIPAETRAFDKSWLGTRMEGNVDVIAGFHRYLDVEQKGDSLFVNAAAGDKIVISAGNPSYQTFSKEYQGTNHSVKLLDDFGKYEGKFVVQLYSESKYNDILIDERIIEITLGTPRMISEVKQTDPAEETPDGMVKIPAGSFMYYIEEDQGFIKYPDLTDTVEVTLPEYYMDKYPVTNEQYAEFIKESGYHPEDDKNYLKHWVDGEYPEGEDDHPVVYVSVEDARAYAEWAGKRLPTDHEWHYAAQGNDLKKWPWGNEFDSTKCNNALDHTTPVDMFPEGESVFGVQDLIGNVWQMTNDIYDNATYYMQIMRGGSYYKPTSSWWYVQGGPRPISQQQILLLVSPGFNRNATVGFRCVKDAE